MLLTLTVTRDEPGGALTDAADLGFLLHKHPDKVQSFALSVGTATVFYPQVEAERCTVTLLLEVDPIALVRGRRGGGEGFALAQYVNDRPYAASSLLAAALGRVFTTALNGRCDARPDLVDVPLALAIHLAAVPARAGSFGPGARGPRGADLVRALFEPLGWVVQATQPPLAEGLDWGRSPYVDVRLTGRLRLADALRHLYVLLPVLDDAKHYWVGPDEVDKLIRRGDGWLATHPLRDLITRRYLRAQGRYVRDATERLLAVDESGESLDESAESVESVDESAESVAECVGGAVSGAFSAQDGPTRSQPLKEIRRDTVLAVLREVGARRVVDVGCGEGYYLKALLADHAFTAIQGVDVSASALARAEKWLGLDRLPEHTSRRLSLRQSSVTYGDGDLAGYDALLLVEVIEHLEPDRLPSMEHAVFAVAGPPFVIVTTPNVEHNVRYQLPEGALRHRDHRFEWTRAQFEDWARAVSRRHGYAVEVRPVGPVDPQVGPPTQLALFRRLDTGPHAPTRPDPHRTDRTDRTDRTAKEAS